MIKHLKFDNKELTYLLWTILISAFILSFKDWGADKFDASTGIRNLLITIIVVAISLVLKLSVQKYFSGRRGFNVVFKPWMIGFLLGIVFIFISKGAFVFLAFGGLIFYLAEKERLGHEEYNLSLSEMGWLSMLGPITSIILALIAKILLTFNPGQYALTQLLSTNLWLAMFSILPIPFVYKFRVFHVTKYGEFGTSDGLKLFTVYPFEYFVVFVITFVNIFAVLLLNVKYAIYATILLMALLVLVYYIFYKMNIKKSSHKYYKYRFE